MNGFYLLIYFYYNLFFEPLIAYLVHNLTTYLLPMDYVKFTYTNLDIYTIKKQYIYIHFRYYILISWSCIYYIFRLHFTYYTLIYIYTQILDIQDILLSIFNIPHILYKIYSTNIFTYIVYITFIMDIIHMAYIIYIAVEKTPPSPATGGGTIWRGGCGGPCLYIFIYIYFS